jgi:hypothetical protein
MWFYNSLANGITHHIKIKKKKKKKKKKKEKERKQSHVHSDPNMDGHGCL